VTIGKHGTEGEGEIALRAIRVHGTDMPGQFVSSRRQRLNRNAKQFMIGGGDTRAAGV